MPLRRLAPRPRRARRGRSRRRRRKRTSPRRSTRQQAPTSPVGGAGERRGLGWSEAPLKPGSCQTVRERLQGPCRAGRARLARPTAGATHPAPHAAPASQMRCVAARACRWPPPRSNLACTAPSPPSCAASAGSQVRRAACVCPAPSPRPALRVRPQVGPGTAAQRQQRGLTDASRGRFCLCCSGGGDAPRHRRHVLPVRRGHGVP